MNAARANDIQSISMDHFAKREDSLISALNNGTMHRSFQGYLKLR